MPTLFLDDDEHEDQLRRCLTDASLPLELWIVGALIRLYGLPLIRIVHLTTDGFHQDERGAYFTFDKNPYSCRRRWRVSSNSRSPQAGRAPPWDRLPPARVPNSFYPAFPPVVHAAQRHCPDNS